MQLEGLVTEQGHLAAMIRVHKALAALEDALQRPLDDKDSIALPEQNIEDTQS